MNKKLSIKTPCQEDWSKMKGDGKKRYCDSCNHHVEDFSDKSVEEIVSILENKEGRTCGRLKRVQLNPITKIAATVMLGSSLLWSCSSDQNEVVELNHNIEGKKVVVNDRDEVQTIISINVSGYVSFANGERIEDALVTIQRTKEGCSKGNAKTVLTNKDGEFDYQSEIPYILLNEYSLVVKYEGHFSSNIPLSAVEGIKGVEVILEEMDFENLILGMMLMGDIVADPYDPDELTNSDWRHELIKPKE